MAATDRLYPQLDDTDRGVTTRSWPRPAPTATPWQRWEDTMAFLAHHLATHDLPPVVDNGIVQRDGQPCYIGADAYPIAVATARASFGGPARPPHREETP